MHQKAGPARTEVRSVLTKRWPRDSSALTLAGRRPAVPRGSGFERRRLPAGGARSRKWALKPLKRAKKNFEKGPVFDLVFCVSAKASGSFG